MSGFEIFKLLHVLGAIVWIGAGFGLFLLSLRLWRAGDREGLLSVGRQSELFGKAVFMPAAVSTLLFGVLMVAIDSRFSFADLWIIIGFAAIAASFVVGVLMLEPADAKLTATLAGHELEHPEVDGQIRRVLRLNSLDLLILVVAVWAMVAKPLL